MTDTRLKPLADMDTSPYMSSEVLARGANGTIVPLSMIYRKRLPLDGSHPAYFEGYGAYGIVLDPSSAARASHGSSTEESSPYIIRAAAMVRRSMTPRRNDHD